MKAVLLYFSIAIALVVTGCLQMPVQQARDIQIETYRQRFEFCDGGSAAVVNAIFGVRNQESLATQKGKGAWSYYLEMAAKHQFEISGQIIFVLSLNPMNPEQFFVEGHGRHIIFNRCNHQLLASSTFQIVDDGPHWVDELTHGSLTVRLRQQTIREFEQDRTRYAHEVDVFARIYIKKVTGKIVTLDYAREHELGISIPSSIETYGDRISIRPIGFIQFDGKRDGRALVDLREIGTSRIKSNYNETLRGAGFSPAGGGPKLEWLPGRSCKIPYRASCPDIAED